MHVHISRHQNHGYVPADDCLYFALIYLCMVCMWLLCECDVSFWFSFGNSPVYLKKAQMTSSYFSNDLSLRYSCIYFSPVTPLYTWENSRNKFGFGFWPFLMVLVYKWVLFLLIMVCMWLLCECDVCFLFDNATLDYMYMYVCIYVCIYIDNATLDYILVIWVCMVRLPPSFLNIFQVPKVS